MKLKPAIKTLPLLAILALMGCSVGAGGETFGALGIGPNGVEIECPTPPDPRLLTSEGAATLKPIFEVNMNAACEAVKVGVNGGSTPPAMASGNRVSMKN